MRYILCATVFAFVSITPVFAWHTNTHLQMTRDAVALMPPEFQKSFTEHQKFVEAGIKDPDELLKDWQNHYYIPASHEGGALDRITKLINVVQMKFKNSTAVDTSKQLCYLAHYIGDLWSPENILKQNTILDKDFVQNNDIIVFYEGYQKPIENLNDYFVQRANWRWRLENSKEISTLLYSEAVNDIARAWLTLWQQAGNDVAPQNPSVILHKKGALNINFDRLLLEERVYWYSVDWQNENYLDSYKTHEDEVERLQKNVAPSDTQMYAKTELRNQEQAMSKLNPAAPFQMIESSMKTIDDKAYFVARVRNKGQDAIPSIAFMYPGVKGPIALLKDLQPGQVAKVEAVLPANATKDQVQLIFASTN